MAKTFEQIVAEEEAKFKVDGKRQTQPQAGSELTLQDVQAPIPLPGLENTKARVSDRGQLIDQLQGVSDLKIDQLSSGIENPALKGLARGLELPLETAAKGAGSIMTAIQAGESGVAGSLLAGLEGKPENMVDEFIQGVTGQKQTRLADLVRATELGGTGFVGEAVAEVGGFLATVGLANLASGGKIATGAKGVQQALKRSSFKGAKKKAFFFRDNAKAWVKGFDDAFSNMGDEFGKVYNKIGNKIIGGDDARALQDAVVNLPKDVASKISKIKGANFLDKFQRVLEPTINNAKIIKDQIRRTIPKNVWNGFDDGGANAELYRGLKDSYFKLNDVIANNAGALKPRLLELNRKFHALHNFSDKLQPIFRNSKGLLKTGVRNIKNISMQGAYKELVRFSNRFFKDGKGLIDGIDKMNRSIAIQQGVRSVVQKAGPTAIGGLAVGAGVGAVAGKPISKAISGLGGGSTAPSSGGGG